MLLEHRTWNYTYARRGIMPQTTFDTALLKLEGNARRRCRKALANWALKILL